MRPGLGLSLLGLLAAACGGTVEAPARPNIVLIMADDLGWSDLGCYGGEIETPSIDSLASAGIRFRSFYSNGLCGPTRSSLLTGLYCQQVGHSGISWNEPRDLSRAATLPQLLGRAGYQTMMVGKWQGQESALECGFERFFGPACQGKFSYFDEVVSNPFFLDEEPWEVPDEGFYITDALTDHAVRFVEEASGSERPFFLYVAFLAPHYPLHAHEEDVAPYREQYLESGWDRAREARYERQREMGLIPESWELSRRPAYVPAWEDETEKAWQAERMAVFAAQVTRMDRNVGRILAALRDAGVAEQTLVAFLSDNGASPEGGVGPTTEGFGFAPGAANDEWRVDGVPIRPGSGPRNLPGPPDTFAAYGPPWAMLSNTPFRGFKASAHEGGIRSPLIVSWPEGILDPDRVSPMTGHVFDLLPTFLEIAGCEYPSTLDGRELLPLAGRSLAPIFRGERVRKHPEISFSCPDNQAVLVGRMKLVSLKRGRRWELYDMSKDGTETIDLSDKLPDSVERLARRYAQWWQRVGNGQEEEAPEEPAEAPGDD
jgi:arylsulfatase